MKNVMKLHVIQMVESYVQSYYSMRAKLSNEKSIDLIARNPNFKF